MSGGFGVFCGSGGAGLNLKVTAYSSALSIPASGAANMIEVAVVTSTALNYGGLILSNARVWPTTRGNGTALQNGDILINYASASSTIFYVNDTIKIPAAGVYQRVGGAWTVVVGYVSIKGAAYANISMLFYYLGEEFSTLTGGWSAVNTGVLKSADNLRVNGTSSSGSPTTQGAYVTQTLFDVTNLSTLYILNARYSSNVGAYFCATPSKDTCANIYNNAYARIQLTSSTSQTWTTLDVSGVNGMVYLAVVAYSTVGVMGSYVYEVYGV